MKKTAFNVTPGRVTYKISKFKAKNKKKKVRNKTGLNQGPIL